MTNPKKILFSYSLLLFGHTNSSSSAASGFGMLTTNTETPVVTKTTVSPDLLQTFQILTELVVQKVSHHLVGLACKCMKT